MAQTLKPGTTTAPADAHGGGHGKVFPPLDSSTFASQLIWLALTFGALYLIMSRIALPRIGKVIEERRDRIQRDLDAAERLKTETEMALAAYEQSLAEAKARAGGIARDTHAQLSAEIEAERTRVDTEIGAKLTQAESRILAMKTKALANVDEIAAATAGTLVTKLIGGDVSADEIKKALEAAPAE